MFCFDLPKLTHSTAEFTKMRPILLTKHGRFSSFFVLPKRVKCDFLGDFQTLCLGSILTTLIDGFLLQKQPIVEEEFEKTVAATSILSKNEDKEETAGGFPVTNILSGIYSLVSSYIQPSEKEDDEEPITAIPQSAINVHNMPRDQLIVEAIEDFQAPPLPILPPEYLRARPIDIEPKPKPAVPENLNGPVLVLTENAKGGKPVSIPDYETEIKEELDVLDPRAFDPVESVRSSDKQHLKQ